MKLRLGLLIIFVGVLAVVAIIVYGLTRPKLPTVPPGNSAPSAPVQDPAATIPGDMSVEGATVTKRDAQGNPVWSLEAETEVKVDADAKQARAEKVHWSLQAAGNTEWVVDAPQIVIDYETGRLVFTDGVQVESANGDRRFTVPKLTYEPDSKRLVGEGGARFSQGGTVVTGQRLVVDTKAKTVRLSGGMKAHIGK